MNRKCANMYCSLVNLNPRHDQRVSQILFAQQKYNPMGNLRRNI